MLSFTGTPAPPNVKYDGVNLIETILGEETNSRENPIFYSRPPDRKNYYGFENLPDLAMHQGTWKLLCDYDGSRSELYNILDDPGETKNMAATNSERVESMTTQAIVWWNSMPKLAN